MKELAFKYILITVLMFLSNLSCHGQIVNVESLRKKTDTTGFAGGVALNGSYLDNDKVIYSINFVPNIQYKWDKDLLLMVVDYKITKSDKVDFEDAAFLHFRYNHKLTDIFRWESFTQIQHNKIAKLDFRFLAGTGIRLKLIGKDVFRLYFGVIPMYEYEQINNAEQSINRNLRMSNYLSFTFKISDQTELYSTSYYQPVFAAIRDYRFYNEQKLRVNLVKNLFLNLATVYTWDNRPPEDAPGRTLQMQTGLVYNF